MNLNKNKLKYVRALPSPNHGNQINNVHDTLEEQVFQILEENENLTY